VSSQLSSSHPKVPHLEQRIALAVVARSPYERIAKYTEKRGRKKPKSLFRPKRGFTESLSPKSSLGLPPYAAETVFMIKELAFVVYPVTNVERAVSFYRDTIGLTPADSFGDTWIEFDVGGSTFGVVGNAESIGLKPGTQFCAAFEVDDIAGMHASLVRKGVTISDVMDFPGCFTAFVTDPDGNRFALHERKQ